MPLTSSPSAHSDCWVFCPRPCLLDTRRGGRYHGSCWGFVGRITLGRITHSAKRVLPRQDLQVHKHKACNDTENQNDQANIPIFPVIVAIKQGSNEQRHHSHELQQNIQGGAGSVLEGIANSVANNTSLTLLGLFELQFFTKFLGVVPSSACVAHHDRHHRRTADTACQQTHEHARADQKASNKRGEHSIEARGNHLLDRTARGDHDTAV
mmetsp:Transcript_21991/g.42843  ORF Transcript_21991/g.42843 Transcript_21991/m.42843 type:complete len:210 (+) Transcript_21991:421-1050(+)